MTKKKLSRRGIKLSAQIGAAEIGEPVGGLRAQRQRFEAECTEFREDAPRVERGVHRVTHRPAPPFEDRAMGRSERRLHDGDRVLVDVGPHALPRVLGPRGVARDSMQGACDVPYQSSTPASDLK